jgi:hypothetical protein
MLTPGRWYHCSTRHMGGYGEIIRQVGRLGQVAKTSMLTLATGCVVEELQLIVNKLFFPRGLRVPPCLPTIGDGYGRGEDVDDDEDMAYDCAFFLSLSLPCFARWYILVYLRDDGHEFRPAIGWVGGKKRALLFFRDEHGGDRPTETLAMFLNLSDPPCASPHHLLTFGAVCSGCAGNTMLKEDVKRFTRIPPCRLAAKMLVVRW